jgi:hypothetical protein
MTWCTLIFYNATCCTSISYPTSNMVPFWRDNGLSNLRVRLPPLPMFLQTLSLSLVIALDEAWTCAAHPLH